MLRLGKVKTGEKILADHYNILVDAILERTPLSFADGLLFRSPHGFHMGSRRKKSGGGVAKPTPLPWDLAISGTESSVKARIAVPSTINGFVPANIFAEFTIGPSGIYYVKLVCLTDGRVITSVNLEVDGSVADTQSPTMSILPSRFEYTVGVIKDGTGFNVARKALTAYSSMLFRTDKSPPAGPGEMAYAEWYNWRVE